MMDHNIDVSVFNGKMPWSQRKELIEQLFPSTTRLEWTRVFKQDPALAGKIINDVIKIDSAEAGRPGKRPPVDEAVAAAYYHKIDQSDYSIYPFHETITMLKSNTSIRRVAAMTELDRNVVYRLLRNEIDPTIEHMVAFANAFNKSPSYFLEYRIAHVVGVLVRRFTENPESSIIPYNKVKKLDSNRKS